MASSDLVVIGRISHVLREEASPIGDKTTSCRITLYGVDVERYLLGSGQDEIKVRQVGGTWDDKTYVEEGNPRPEVGKRYLLFMCDEGRKFGHRSFGFHVAGSSANLKYDGELDEYGFTTAKRSKVLLEGGGTHVPSDPHLKEQPKAWVFSNGAQILGVTEEQAIEAVLRQVEQVRRESPWRFE